MHEKPTPLKMPGPFGWQAKAKRLPHWEPTWGGRFRLPTPTFRMASSSPLACRRPVESPSVSARLGYQAAPAGDLRWIRRIVICDTIER
jgi:hypothetical protein